MITLLSLSVLVSHELLGQQPVHIQSHSGQEGRGILKARSGECFVITPAHVVQDENRPYQIRGARNVLSKGMVMETYPSDLAIVRILEGGAQNCEDWQVDSDYGRILAQSVEGFLEITQTNGAVQSIKVFLSEKDNTQIVVRPHFPDEQISKGMSGSALFTTSNGKKTYLGMLTDINNPTTGIVLPATVMDNVLSSFFTNSTTRRTEVAVITVKGGVIDAFELAQQASDILAKQYPNYSFVPYEKGKPARGKAVCEISEFTENDSENRVDGQIHKYKTRMVLTVMNDGHLISRETLDGGGTDYSKESAQLLSVMRTLERTEKLKFDKR